MRILEAREGGGRLRWKVRLLQPSPRSAANGQELILAVGKRGSEGEPDVSVSPSCRSLAAARHRSVDR